MLRTIADVDAAQIYRKAECSARELRDYLQLDFVIPVNAWAKRPACAAQIDSLCKEKAGDTIGRGFSLTAFGCVCHRCLYPQRARQWFVRANVPTTKPTARGKRNRWDNYVRPMHNCVCGKTISDYRAKHCVSCAAKQREAKRKSKNVASA